MEGRLNKRHFWLGTILISVISMLDYQFLASTHHMLELQAIMRGFLHISILLIILLIGCFVWRGMRFTVHLWIYIYLLVIVFISVAGLTSYSLNLPISKVPVIGFIRPFFCSPMPMLIFYMLRSLSNNHV